MIDAVSQDEFLVHAFKESISMNMTRHIIGVLLGVLLFSGMSLAAEPAEVEKFVKARVDIGEMMTNYFQGGGQFKGGQRPSADQMKEMGADIHTKLGKLLTKYDLTVEEYRKRSPEIFADEAAVKSYLNEHPDMKARYEALPLDRMGRGGSTGRGY
jgi:hypothetical protein